MWQVVERLNTAKKLKDSFLNRETEKEYVNFPIVPAFKGELRSNLFNAPHEMQIGIIPVLCLRSKM